MRSERDAFCAFCLSSEVGCAKEDRGQQLRHHAFGSLCASCVLVAMPLPQSPFPSKIVNS
jgi:hypothetical protein